MFFMCELQNVKTGSNYLKQFDWSVADFMHFAENAISWISQVGVHS